MTRKTWLFIGASGRIGRMLMAHWRQEPPKGMRIVAQSRHSQETDVLVWSPLGGANALLAWIDHHGPVDGMFVFSGVTPAPLAKLSDNATLAEACLSAAHVANIPTVLLATSSAVYGAGNGTAMRETAPLQPANDYGRAKVAAEAVCAGWRANGTDVTCLRIGNVIGADALLLNAENASVASPLRLDVFADGHGPRRSYIGPATLARVLAKLASSEQLPESLNIAAPMPVTMQSLISEVKVPWVGTAAPATAHQNITLDCSLLANFFSFVPSASDPKTMIAEWQGLKDQE